MTTPWQSTASKVSPPRALEAASPVASISRTRAATSSGSRESRSPARSSIAADGSTIVTSLADLRKGHALIACAAADVHHPTWRGLQVIAKVLVDHMGCGRGLAGCRSGHRQRVPRVEPRRRPPQGQTSRHGAAPDGITAPLRRPSHADAQRADPPAQMRPRISPPASISKTLQIGASGWTPARCKDRGRRSGKGLGIRLGEVAMGKSKAFAFDGGAASYSGTGLLAFLVT